MTLTRPPEQELYAFSQWLLRWADYALSQAKLFTETSNSGYPGEESTTTAIPPAPQEHQPPAHWLALFEEYGLDPPKTGDKSGEVRAGSQGPASTPRPLQDWLGEFQRGLAQFAQQEVPLTPAQSTSGESFAESSALPSLPEEEAHLPHRPAHTPGPYSAQQRQEQSVPGFPRVEREGDRPLPTSLPPGSDVEADRSLYSPTIEWAGGDQELSPSPPVLHGPGDLSQVAEAVPGVRNEPARIPAQIAQQSIETSPTPVRLRLNPRPPEAALSPPADAGESVQPALIQQSQAVRPLFTGGPADSGEPLPANPTPQVLPAGMPRPSEPAQPPAPFTDIENILPEIKPVEADLLPEEDLDLLPPPPGQREESILSDIPLQEHREQSSPEWSQPSEAHWPELPERLPPVQPPINVLADPTHRMRIDREQKGRTWIT